MKKVIHVILATIAMGFGLILSGGVQEAAAQQLETLEIQVEVAASPTEVWQAWTTVEGLQSFFGRKAIVDLRTDGEFSIHFFPENPAGQRGAEGMMLLAIEPEQRLAFTWDAPPKWPQIRNKRTFVEVLLDPIDAGSTRVTLRHMGWGRGQEWSEVRDYFAQAWIVVLKRLKYAFDSGPIDWDDMPDGL